MQPDSGQANPQHAASWLPETQARPPTYQPTLQHTSCEGASHLTSAVLEGLLGRYLEEAQDSKKVELQLGTLGGGNHFLEVSHILI